MTELRFLFSFPHDCRYFSHSYIWGYLRYCTETRTCCNYSENINLRILTKQILLAVELLHIWRKWSIKANALILHFLRLKWNSTPAVTSHIALWRNVFCTRELLHWSYCIFAGTSNLLMKFCVFETHRAENCAANCSCKAWMCVYQAERKKSF